MPRSASATAVSVIVAARDAAPTIRRTLIALAAQELAQQFEVIVVDDGSRDETAALVDRCAPAAELIRLPSSVGPGEARNRGVAAARAPVLAFTDADCFPTPTWLAGGLRALADADLVQGRVEPDPAARRTPFDRTLEVGGDRGFYQTANLFVRRETFDAVGGFRDWALADPNRRRWSIDRRRGRAGRTPIGEDTLFAWSALRQGARSAYAPDAVVRHAVVPGGLADEIADRLHWARDMPGLVRLVPELRATTLFGRMWFNHWTAQFDLAVLGAAMALARRQGGWLAAAGPYVRRLVVECRRYPAAEALSFLLGSPLIEAATLLALLRGSVEWRCLVL